MVKVKTFFLNSQNWRHIERLDDVINHFISENGIEVIDIKYNTASCGDNNLGLYASAMLIYKEKEQ